MANKKQAIEWLKVANDGVDKSDIQPSLQNEI